MAATKTAKTLLASVTLVPGTPQAATEWNLSTAYGGVICGKVTNGATGPTVGADFVVQVGEATGVKRELSRQTAPTGNNAVQDFIVEIPPGVMFVNSKWENNTVQNVTVEIYGQELTGI